MLVLLGSRLPPLLVSLVLPPQGCAPIIPVPTEVSVLGMYRFGSVAFGSFVANFAVSTLARLPLTPSPVVLPEDATVADEKEVA